MVQGDARPLALQVDGITVATLDFAPTGAWENWGVESVDMVLPAGMNSVALVVTAESLTGPNLDAMSLTALGADPVFDPESPVNSSPSDITLTNFDVPENVPGAVVGTLSATDAEGDVVAFSLTDPRFEIVGSVLKLVDGVALDFETASSIDLVVQADDGEGGQTSATLVLSVLDAEDDDDPTAPEPTDPGLAYDATFQAEDATIALASGQGTVTLIRDAANPDPGIAGCARGSPAQAMLILAMTPAMRWCST